jgi:hypothetical protein
LRAARSSKRSPASSVLHRGSDVYRSRGRSGSTCTSAISGHARGAAGIVACRRRNARCRAPANAADLRRSYGRVEGVHASGFLEETAGMYSSLPHQAARGCESMARIAPPGAGDNGARMSETRFTARRRRPAGRNPCSAAAARFSGFCRSRYAGSRRRKAPRRASTSSPPCPA